MNTLASYASGFELDLDMNGLLYNFFSLHD
jgi:hypothetical protein